MLTRNRTIRKLNKAIEQSKEIINKYKSYSKLKKLHSLYIKRKRNSNNERKELLQKARSDYMKFQHLKKNIESFQSFLNNDYQQLSVINFTVEMSINLSNSTDNLSITLDCTFRNENK